MVGTSRPGFISCLCQLVFTLTRCFLGVTYVHIADVQDSGVELEAQSLGLLDRVGQLAVGLQ